MPTASACPPLLCAVIIARNEEAHIRDCIHSVLTATAPFGPCEVLLVDSCSEDRTVDIARTYPIRVVELAPRQRCCPAMGRYVGAALSRGQYILFVDGDTAIDAAWLPTALRVLAELPDVAGISGRLHEVYYRGGTPIEESADPPPDAGPIQEAYQLGGNALYRKPTLDAVGSFNPYIRSFEEAELAERLRVAGYRVVRTSVRLGTHHTPLRRSVREPWRRFREGLMVGHGQVLRLSLRTGTFWSHAHHLNRFLLFTLFEVAGGALLAASLLLRDARYIVCWVLAGITVWVLMLFRSRSFSATLSVIGDWALAGPAILWGFTRHPRDPGTFSLGAVLRQPDQSATATNDGATGLPAGAPTTGWCERTPGWLP